MLEEPTYIPISLSSLLPYMESVLSERWGDILSSHGIECSIKRHFVVNHSCGGRVGYFGFSQPMECIWSSHYIADSSQEKLMCSCMGGVHSTVFYNKFNSTKIFMQC